MTQEPSGWYADPTRRHIYRYWDGQRWTEQVSDGGTPGVDPIDVEGPTASTPPAPGTKAPAPGEPTPPQTVAVTQSSSGTGLGVILGVLIALAIVAVVIFALMDSGSEDDGGTVTTLAPVTTVTEAPTTTP